MNFSRENLFTRRHFFEFLGLSLFWFILVNPLEFSVSFIYSNLTPEVIKDYVLGLGVWAPLGMMLLEILQVVVAPLPPVTLLASGYTFGVLHGSLYSFVGASIGSLISLWFGRRFGKSLISWIVSEQHVESFNNFTDNKGVAGFFIIFLLPGFPHDALCYVAGLTKLDFRKLAAAIILGRIPRTIGLVWAGDNIAESNSFTAGLILILFTSTGFIVVKNQKKVASFGRKLKKLVKKQ